ncbi:uncharacterized protein DS421_5g145790 [Arachis hypogaea]|nr:uncharacterized protein DS421_5g145790 [Arachis hypogaea]
MFELNAALVRSIIYSSDLSTKLEWRYIILTTPTYVIDKEALLFMPLYYLFIFNYHATNQFKPYPPTNAFSFT